MDAIGGQVNAFTSKECTCYYAKVIAEHLERAMDLLSDLLLGAKLEEEEFEKERGVILEEIDMYEDTPDDLCAEKLFAEIFGDNALARPILGTPETLEAMTGESLRDFHRRHYRADNTVVSLCGSFKEEDLEAGVREGVEEDSNKKNKADFVLWFTKSKFDDQELKWDSPWGIGYPGWHIECSCISMKHLGEYLDIHCGGIDNAFPHHTNEIAQSEAFLGHKWCNYWFHILHLNTGSGKMSKSKGEFLTVSLLESKGYDPLAYRMFCLGSHYRKSLVFSWEGLDNATVAYNKLIEKIAKIDPEDGEFDEAAAEALKLVEGLDLAELFIVSAVTGSEAEGEALAQGTGTNLPGMIIQVYAAPGEKCPRCWMHSTKADENGLCPRCSAVMANFVFED
jgi:hypothetical protein